MPVVAVSTDVFSIEGVSWHACQAQYIEAAARGAGLTPLLLPSIAIDLDDLLDAVDGVLLTGSKSNVHPALYGVGATEANGPYDQARDAATLPLIRAALARGVPLFAICRGMQELNVAAGGTLVTEIQERPGALDHRAPVSDSRDECFAIRQLVDVSADSRLAGILGSGPLQVNSLHRQGIGVAGEGIVAEAVASDGIIEAVSVRAASGFAIGVQWHPEYWVASDPISAKLFAAFGDAVRAHAKARRGKRS